MSCRKIASGGVEVIPEMLSKMESFLEERADEDDAFPDFFISRLEKVFYSGNKRYLFKDVGIPGK